MSNRTDFDALSTWAESDLAVAAAEKAVKAQDFEHHTAPSGMIKREFAKVGRPSLGPSGASSGSSPRRQVRLSNDLNDALDVFASVHEISASKVIRLALHEFLANHQPQAQN